MKLHHLFENKVPKITSPLTAFNYAEDQGKRIPELEPVIMKNPKYAYWYAKNIIKDVWPEAEPIIMKDPQYAIWYVLNISKKKTSKCEPLILKNPHTAVAYAREVLKKRWPKAEPMIMKDPASAVDYAINVIKGRWPEAELYIKTDPVSENRYIQKFPELRTQTKDIPLVLGKYAITDVPNTITDEQVLNIIKIIEPEAFGPPAVDKRLYSEVRIKQKLNSNELVKITTKQIMNNEQEKKYFLQDLECWVGFGEFE